MSANSLVSPTTAILMPGTAAAPGVAAGTGSGADMPGAAMDKNRTVVADGTPTKVVGMAIAAAATLILLKYAGFQFHVGVSN